MKGANGDAVNFGEVRPEEETGCEMEDVETLAHCGSSQRPHMTVSMQELHQGR